MTKLVQPATKQLKTSVERVSDTDVCNSDDVFAEDVNVNVPQSLRISLSKKKADPPKKKLLLKTSRSSSQKRLL